MSMSNYRFAIRVAQAMKNTQKKIKNGNRLPGEGIPSPWKSISIFDFFLSDVYVEFRLSRIIFNGLKNSTYRVSTVPSSVGFLKLKIIR